VIDTLVLHYTGMATAAEALARLLDPQAKVSAHYLIDEDGSIVQLVDEAMRAWHAGVSFWRGQTGVNARSIGIELVNPGHDWGYRPFPEPQMAATIGLARGLLARHPIAAGNVVGHSDIAPRRKADPGELFDWRRLAAEGIGLWPEPADALLPMDEPTVADLLARIGYETVDLRASLKALQRHFRPARVNGRLDFETARLLQGLAEICATA
jgi:N-acetylmuramoyl-L-alanine amidase